MRGHVVERGPYASQDDLLARLLTRQLRLPDVKIHILHLLAPAGYIYPKSIHNVFRVCLEVKIWLAIKIHVFLTIRVLLQIFELLFAISPEFVDVLEHVRAHIIVLLQNDLSQVVDVLLAPLHFFVVILGERLHQVKLDLFVYILSCLTLPDRCLKVFVIDFFP